ncbi:MAG TPA: GAF domain-containing sensor histidine kinase [Actinomycetospora sp.]|nr:GAF domain-containing sensor histidine kinase [Actinomycetospora sp.]
MPCAVVNLIGEHFQHQVAAVGITPSVCSREDAMCAVTIGEAEPVAVPDAREDPRFAANPFVTGRLAHIRFYAASQLRAPSGAVLGTLCVFDETVRELTAEQRHALDLLARQAVGALELRRAYRALTATVQDLAQARDELLRSNSQLAAFAGQVSHDLRNPLAGVTGFLELLADHPAVAAEVTATAHVDRALAAAARMREMVDDLLAYARVGGTLRTERVDLGALLGEVLHDVPPGTLDTVEIDLGVLPTVRGDRTQLRAVLANVVANALRFARPDRGLVLRARARPEGDRWVVEIADNGIGVPPDRREEAFTLLRQVHDQGAAVGGSGIGLATCRRILTAHGGTVALDDGIDGGTAVRISLPAA